MNIHHYLVWVRAHSIEKVHIFSISESFSMGPYGLWYIFLTNQTPPKLWRMFYQYVHNKGKTLTSCVHVRWKNHVHSYYRDIGPPKGTPHHQKVCTKCTRVFKHLSYLYNRKEKTCVIGMILNCWMFFPPTLLHFIPTLPLELGWQGSHRSLPFLFLKLWTIDPSYRDRGIIGVHVEIPLLTTSIKIWIIWEIIIKRRNKLISDNLFTKPNES